MIRWALVLIISWMFFLPTLYSTQLDLSIKIQRQEFYLQGEFNPNKIQFSSNRLNNQTFLIKISLEGKEYQAHFAPQDKQGSYPIISFISEGKKANSPLSELEILSLALLHRQLSAKLDPQMPNELLLLKSIDFLINFYPKKQTFMSYHNPEFNHNLDITEELLQLRRVGSSNENPPRIYLCDKIGEMLEGSFTLEEEVITQSRLVGAKESECFGRCGTGCSQVFQITSRIYTKDCFDHDLCSRHTDDWIIGQCFDEFWRATDDYMFGSQCKKEEVIAH